MANLNGFNANEVEPSTSFEPLPAGKYLAAITASAMKATKKGDGSYLELELTVLEGECKGRKVWDRLNINNPNAVATQIARGHLSAICRAVGVMTPRDSVDLHNLPLVITVKLKKRDDIPGGGELTNEIKGYAKKDAAGANGQQSQAPVADNTPPWKR
ncbi:DUF669 domain-containing protein [Mucisphaera calidilacus]|uniref:DUF669 domain-containing protein n=1 Tax=Mucisphaera calidilacus TaxID=2527982 RepID=A0A518BVQ8_9BACT|nr:DUF669 domain-containing protein [Mucisphaera calidilacus]QDU71062.1 hypothetical protein Pan265_09070 [Mucisphaera calidilacus]